MISSLMQSNSKPDGCKKLNQSYDKNYVRSSVIILSILSNYKKKRTTHNFLTYWNVSSKSF